MSDPVSWPNEPLGTAFGQDGFVTCPEITTAYKRDAFLRNKSCPWIMNMKLHKGEPVHFQIEVNSKGMPSPLKRRY